MEGGKKGRRKENGRKKCSKEGRKGVRKREARRKDDKRIKENRR